MKVKKYWIDGEYFILHVVYQVRKRLCFKKIK